MLDSEAQLGCWSVASTGRWKMRLIRLDVRALTAAAAAVGLLLSLIGRR